MARRKRVLIAKRSGLVLRQTFEKEGRSLKRRAGGYAHARQYRRLRRVLRRQRTILGRVLRDLERRLPMLSDGIKQMVTLWLERARRIIDCSRIFAIWISREKATTTPHTTSGSSHQRRSRTTWGMDRGPTAAGLAGEDIGRITAGGRDHGRRPPLNGSGPGLLKPAGDVQPSSATDLICATTAMPAASPS